MFTWLTFFTLSFWLLIFSLLIVCKNFFFLLVVSETVWLILYCLNALVGSLIDDVTITGFTFFILGFAAVELSVGLMLLVYLKYLNVSLNLTADFNTFTLPTAPAFMRAALQRARW